jgi:uracil DNA glycosylase
VTPDSFRRLLLIVACTAYLVGLGAVWIWVAWQLAVFAGVGGLLLALILTVEPSTPAEHAGAGVASLEGLSRRDITRRSEGRG